MDGGTMPPMTRRDENPARDTESGPGFLRTYQEQAAGFHMTFLRKTHTIKDMAQEPDLTDRCFQESVPSVPLQAASIRKS